MKSQSRTFQCRSIISIVVGSKFLYFSFSFCLQQDETFFSLFQLPDEKNHKCNHANKFSDFLVNCSVTVRLIRVWVKNVIPSSQEMYLTARLKDGRETRSGEPEAGPRIMITKTCFRGGKKNLIKVISVTKTVSEGGCSRA